jgi:cytochrome P450
MYDPYDPDIHDDPYPVYARLRAEAPVFHNTERDFWVLSRFADVMAAVHDTATYSSAQGVTIGHGADAVLPLMIMMDPPQHQRLRSLVSRAFTPKAIAALEPRIRVIAADLADELWAAGGGDLVTDFTEPFPTLVIAELLGVDPADRGFFKEKSNQLARQNPFEPEGQAAVLEPALALFTYFGDVLDDRVAHPRDDFITALMVAEVDGERLGRDELLGLCFLLLVAGNETTTNLLGNAAVLFHREPQHRTRLESHPELLGVAVEELLRHSSPVQGLARTTMRPVEIGGQPIPEGAKVLLLYGSANRDDAEFDRAAEFDLDRRPERHLAFGHGVHHCLGAALARLEGRVGLEELIGRRPRYTLVDTPVEWIRSGPVRGPRRLPVVIGQA